MSHGGVLELPVETWNLHHGFSTDGSAAAWQALTRERRPDVAVLQEAPPPAPAFAGSETLLYSPDSTLKIRSGGTAIWLRSLPFRRHELAATVPGAITVAEIDWDGRPVTMICIYAKLEHLLDTKYSITTLHHVLSDLTGLLEARNRRSRILVGGDFNADPAWDAVQRNRSHRLLFDRVEDFGLRSVLPYDSSQHDTFRRNASIRQLDYLFVSEEAAVGQARVLTHSIHEHLPTTRL